METRFEQQLKKGVLEMVVLHLICEKPAHGYELILRLRGSPGGLLAVKEGTLYPILYRLEDDGLIASSWQPPATQPGSAGRAMPKKTYSATEAGRAALGRQMQSWAALTACVGSLMAGAAQQTLPAQTAQPAPRYKGDEGAEKRTDSPAKEDTL